MGKTFRHSPHTITLAAMAGLMLATTPAMAQPPENHGQSPHGGQAPAHGGGNGGGAPQGRPAQGGAPAARPAPQGAPAQQAAPRPQQNFGGNNAPRGGAPGGQPGGQFNGQRGPGGPGGPGFNGGPGYNANAGRNPNWGPGAAGQPRINPGPQRGAFDEHRAPGPGGAYRAWSNQWRGDNRYDWRGWRDAHRDVYHLGRYYAPYRDYAYRRLSIGFVLDPLFFGNGYMIYDPGTYRLPDAYGPYRWIRYYNDAVLVDTYTGQVVDVLYGFFW
jgi:hypothetical protein